MSEPVRVQPVRTNSTTSVLPSRLSDSYVLLTAAYNEEAYIEQTIQSVIGQVHPPSEWIIVDDGSKDRTAEIAARYAETHDFIRVLTRKKNEKAGHDWAAKVVALRYGLDHLCAHNYSYLGVLDADISVQNDYFKKIVLEFERNPSLGIAGGDILELQDGRFQHRPDNREYQVPGAVQLFRRKCYEQIGGLEPIPGGHEDTVAETKARMHGWETRSFVDIPARHNRKTSCGGNSFLYVKYKEGVCQYYVGYHPIYQIASSLVRFKEKPFFLVGLARLAGFWSAILSGKKRYTSSEFVSYLRAEQKRRLKESVRSMFRRELHDGDIPTRRPA